MSYGSLTVTSFVQTSRLSLRILSSFRELPGAVANPSHQLLTPTSRDARTRGAQQGRSTELKDELASTGDSKTDAYMRLIAALIAQRGGDWREYLRNVRRLQDEISKIGSDQRDDRSVDEPLPAIEINARGADPPIYLIL